MEWKAYLLCGSLLLLTFHLRSSAAHPMAEQDTAGGGPDTFKAILGRLEEKLEELEGSPDVMEDGARRPNDSGAPPRESGVTDGNPFALSNAILKGLRSLQSRKMMRGSNCFGRRIDRIDSVSGMGCNGSRRVIRTMA
ncbi:PREDICTED: natriuretic peptides A-like [Nanorana parkeri]|uniref:natriuretic peptides A-like n=1 Tax=Nanorana parkeri TaxID=125878 RepID=UPI0008548B5B|nr:PREDICTED: natriuretic peptides A-like [Nanorana parkeri]